MLESALQILSGNPVHTIIVLLIAVNLVVLMSVMAIEQQLNLRMSILRYFLLSAGLPLLFTLVRCGLPLLRGGGQLTLDLSYATDMLITGTLLVVCACGKIIGSGPAKSEFKLGLYFAVVALVFGATYLVSDILNGNSSGDQSYLESAVAVSQVFIGLACLTGAACTLVSSDRRTQEGGES